MNELKTEQKMIPLDKISLKKEDHNREVEIETHKLELDALMETIRKNGLLQNLIVKPDGNGSYELIAGMKRYLCLQKLDPTTKHEVPCTVASCSSADEEEAIRSIENAQRSALHPLDEAMQMKLLLDTSDIDEVCICFGRSRTYCYMRMALLDLIPDLKKAYKEGRISNEEALMAAREPEVIQKKLRPEAHNFGQVISTGHCQMKGARFPTSECENCPKRTGHAPELFSDIATDKDELCLDASCFKSKTAEYVKSQYEKAVKKYDDVIPVSGCYGAAPKLGGKKALGNWDYQEAKKDDKDAKPAIIVNGDKAGKIIMIHDPGKSKEKPEADKDADRRNELYDAAKMETARRVIDSIWNCKSPADYADIAFNLLDDGCIFNTGDDMIEAAFGRYVEKHSGKDSDGNPCVTSDDIKALMQDDIAKFTDQGNKCMMLVRWMLACIVIEGLDNIRTISYTVKSKAEQGNPAALWCLQNNIDWQDDIDKVFEGTGISKDKK